MTRLEGGASQRLLIVVDGKYRIVMDSLSSPDDVISLVKFLVARSSTR